MMGAVGGGINAACTHPRAKHRHGTYVCGKRDRCGCGPCRSAVRDHNRTVTRRNAYGRSPWVDAAPVREHVSELLGAGMTIAELEKAAGVDRSIIRHLLGAYGKPPAKRVRKDNAERLTAAPVRRGFVGERGWVAATGTMRRVHALNAIGWPNQELSRRLGYPVSTRSLQFGKRGVVLAATAQAVDALYRELRDIPGPSDRVKETARNRGWLSPVWWDDDTIDDPQHVPDGLREYVYVNRRLVVLDDYSLPRGARIALLRRAGWSTAAIAERIGTLSRYVLRDELEGRVALPRITTPVGESVESVELDEILVARLMAGSIRIDERATLELVEAVRRLAAQGLPDRLIGERVGRTDQAVQHLRKVHEIPSTVAAEYRPLGFSTVGSHRHKHNRTSRSTSSAVRATRSEDVASHLLEEAQTA
jgi:hypothetical protein